MGQNFSWLEWIGHRFDRQRGRRQRGRNLRNADRRICVKIECRWFCKSIKGQSKTTKTYFCQLIHENFSCWGQNLDWYWTTEIFAFQCPVPKKLINLLHHGSLPRDNDGAIEFWRIKDYLQDHFVFCHHWSDEKSGRAHKKRCQSCADSSGTIVYPSCASTCIRHGRNIKTRCIGSTSNLLEGKDWSSIRHDRTRSFFTKHSQHVVSRKLFGWKFETSYTKKFLRHLVGFRSCSTTRRRSCSTSRRFPTNPTKPKSNHDRTGRPVVRREPVCSPSTFNERDIDFRISGLPLSVVKQTENSRVRELVKKIENHPHRQDLQADLQQHDAYNPFSEKSKRMI